MTQREFNAWADRFLARLEAARVARHATTPAETIELYEREAEQIPR